MSLLLLIRHALTETTGKILYGRAPGIGLSAHGREQVEVLVARLSPLPIVAVYSSPLERCLETAEPLARSLGLSVIPREALLEGDVGDWTGRALTDLRRLKAWRRLLGTPSSFRYPGGESFLDFRNRTVEEADRIAAAHPDDQVAIVSHGDNIRLLVSDYAGAHLDMFQRVVVHPASVSAVAVSAHGGPPSVLHVNDIGTVADLLSKKKGKRGNLAR
jgi:probable phosphomutase (TIGR03848 family)